MSAFEIFNELLFGGGAWLGLLLILAIIFIVCLIEKYASIIFIPISIFFGFQYLDNVPTNSDFMWSAIFMFLTSILLAVRLAKGWKR